MTDMGRTRNGISVRRPRKKRNLQNDARIKASAERFDSGVYTRLQFLRAMCPSLGAHTVKRFNALLTPVTTMTPPTQSLNRMDPRRPHLQPVPTLPRGRQPPNRFRTGKGRSMCSYFVRWHQASDPSCMLETVDISSITAQSHDFLVVYGHYIKPMKTLFHG